MQHRMIDQVRKSQMSSQMMQAAARGALAVQSGEMMEILVHLALHNKVFSEQARMTLAGWDEKASIGVAADPATSKEVLGYLVSPKNLRPALLPALLENPSVEQEALLELAATGARWVAEALLINDSAKKSAALMEALRKNPRLRPNELASIGSPTETADSVPLPALSESSENLVTHQQEANPETSADLTSSDDSEPVPEEVVVQAITSYLQQNQTELEVQADKPFELVVVHEGTGIEGATEVAPTPTTAPSSEVVSAPPVPAPAGATSAGTSARPAKKPVPPAESRRDSTLQKISRLDIKGRIALAMRGNKEERGILIRDSTKLVALAVLTRSKNSPIHLGRPWPDN